MTAFAKTLASLNVGWILLGYFAVMAIFFLIFRSCKKTRPYVGQLMVITGILVIAALFFILTFSFKTSKMATGATARTMPRTWCAALIPVGLLCYISILKGDTKPDEPFGRWKFVLGVIAAVFISVFLFAYIGYYLSSAIFLVLLMLLLHERNPITLIAVPVVWDLIAYFVFAKFLYISLPIGAIFEKIL